MKFTGKIINNYVCTYFFFSVHIRSCCPQAEQILPKLLAKHKRESKSATTKNEKFTTCFINKEHTDIGPNVHRNIYCLFLDPYKTTYTHTLKTL